MTAKNTRSVLVTGAQGGLGSFVVRKFLELGYQVTGTTIPYNPSEIDKTLPVSWISVDLTSSKSVQEAFRGKVFDIVVHCAGGFRYAPVDQTKDEDFDFLVNTNFKSSFLLARELLPAMKQQNFGRFVFVSARATFHPTAGLGVYAASKAALNLLTQTLAEETKSFNITVNSVLPTIIDTPANRRDMPKANFSDWVSPQELAEIITTLVSPVGKPIHGALIPVSGKL